VYFITFVFIDYFLNFAGYFIPTDPNPRFVRTWDHTYAEERLYPDLFDYDGGIEVSFCKITFVKRFYLVSETFLYSFIYLFCFYKLDELS
jgi:hypothetical protein